MLWIKWYLKICSHRGSCQGIPSGIEDAKAAYQIMLTGFPDYQTVIDDLIAEGDKVLLVSRCLARIQEILWAFLQRGNALSLQEFILLESQTAKL